MTSSPPPMSFRSLGRRSRDDDEDEKEHETDLLVGQEEESYLSSISGSSSWERHHSYNHHHHHRDRHKDNDDDHHGILQWDSSAPPPPTVGDTTGRGVRFAPLLLHQPVPQRPLRKKRRIVSPAFVFEDGNNNDIDQDTGNGDNDEEVNAIGMGGEQPQQPQRQVTTTTRTTTMALSSTASVSSSSSTTLDDHDEYHHDVDDDDDDDDLEMIEEDVTPTAATFPPQYQHLGDLYAALLSDIADQRLVGVLERVQSLFGSLVNPEGCVHDHDDDYDLDETLWDGHNLASSTSSLSSSLSMLSLDLPSLDHRGRETGEPRHSSSSSLSSASFKTPPTKSPDKLEACAILLRLGCHKTMIELMERHCDWSPMQYYGTKILEEFLWVPLSSPTSATTFMAMAVMNVDGESYCCYDPPSYDNDESMEEDNADSINDNDHLGRRHGCWGRTVSSTTFTPSLSGRDLINDAGGCQVVLQILRSGSAHIDNVQLQRTACRFLRTLLLPSSSSNRHGTRGGGRGPPSSNRRVVNRFVRSTESVATLLHLAVDVPSVVAVEPWEGPSSAQSLLQTGSGGGGGEGFVTNAAATYLLGLVVTQCPHDLRNDLASYIRQYFRKYAARNETHLEDVHHFADWAASYYGSSGNSGQDCVGGGGGGSSSNNNMLARLLEWLSGPQYDEEEGRGSAATLYRDEQYMLE